MKVKDILEPLIKDGAGGLALALGTDGYEAGKHNIVDIAVCPISGNPDHIYVEGGWPDANNNVNRIGIEAYRSTALSRDEAWEWLVAKAASAPFMLGHNSLSFHGPHLEAFAAGIRKPVALVTGNLLDTLVVARALRGGTLRMLRAKTADEVLTGLARLPTAKLKGGCSLKDLATHYKVDTDPNDTLAACNAALLAGIWTYMLEESV